MLSWVLNKKTTDQPKLHEITEEIRSESDRMNRMFEKLLGTQTVSTAQLINVNDIVASTIHTYRLTANLKKIKISL